MKLLGGPVAALGTCLLLICVMPAFSSVQEDPEPVPEEPVVWTTFLEGNWRGDQDVGGTRLYELVQWAWVLENSFLECSAKVKDPISGNMVLEGKGLLHQDSAAGTCSFHWFDSSGTAKSYAGKAPEEEKPLVLTCDDGEQLSFTRTDDGYRLQQKKPARDNHEEIVVNITYRKTTQ